MEQFGKVVEARGEKALVKIRKHDACSECGRCGGALGGPDTKDSMVEVSDPLGVEPGSTVRLETDDRSLLLAAFIVYILPLLAFIGGIAAGQYLANFLGIGNEDFIGLLAGFGLMTVVYLKIKQWDNSLSENSRYQVRITDVIEREIENMSEDPSKPEDIK